MHHTVHGQVYGRFDFSGQVGLLLKILPVLAVQGGNGRYFVQFGKQGAGQADGKRGVDVYKIYSAAEKLGVKLGIQHSRGNIIVVADDGKRRAADHLIGKRFVVRLAVVVGGRAEDNHVTVFDQPPGIVVHHLDDTVHHGIPRVYE